jgi:hypothetical protein
MSTSRLSHRTSDPSADFAAEMARLHGAQARRERLCHGARFGSAGRGAYLPAKDALGPDELPAPRLPPPSPRSATSTEIRRATGECVPQGERHEALKRAAIGLVEEVASSDDLLGALRAVCDRDCETPRDDAESGAASLGRVGVALPPRRAGLRRAPQRVPSESARPRPAGPCA